MNEYINPTKATYAGMSPSDLTLIRQECAQPFAQGLIEETNSDWACQAFYEEKQSEQIWGKKRCMKGMGSKEPLIYSNGLEGFTCETYMSHRETMTTIRGKNYTYSSKMKVSIAFLRLVLDNIWVDLEETSRDEVFNRQAFRQHLERMEIRFGQVLDCMKQQEAEMQTIKNDVPQSSSPPRRQLAI
ncbi:hypothetical protein FNV43_RR10317 [Rhamnella rubrinervis]|uniref:Uncharacterized protein n=1 Tax=Rhamnella rubrinervis TaxID=2594499 RepID=A0A8K0ML10_9ROSA|nr:hypothetical protein FNV43_RR10317 [Rhamnella rubrinervis]